MDTTPEMAQAAKRGTSSKVGGTYYVVQWHTCSMTNRRRRHSPEHKAKHHTLREAIAAAAGAPRGHSVYINWDKLKKEGGVAYLFTPRTGELIRYRAKTPADLYFPPGVRTTVEDESRASRPVA